MALPLSDIAIPYTDQDYIEDLLSENGLLLCVNDDGTGTITPTEQTRIQYAINMGTARVNSYCITLYDPADLATSFSVINWATIIATRWLVSRRRNPISSSLLMQYEETIEELKAVKFNQMPIDDLAYRNAYMPCWSNIRVDNRYILRQMRIERPISDRSPVSYPQNVDGLSEVLVEPTLYF